MNTLYKKGLPMIGILLLFSGIAHAQWYTYAEFATTRIEKKHKRDETSTKDGTTIQRRKGDKKKLCDVTTAGFPGTTEKSKAFFAPYAEAQYDPKEVAKLEEELKSVQAALKALIDARKAAASGETTILDTKIKEHETKEAELNKAITDAKAKAKEVESKDGIFSLEHAYLNYLTESKRAALYSEVMHDYLGSVRVSLGLLVALPARKDSAKTTQASDSVWNKKSFIDKFRSAGGVAQLSFSYPLFHLQVKEAVDFKLFATPRFAIDLPQEDTSVQRFAHHTQLNAEAQLKINTLEQNFTFLLCWKGMVAWGNRTFYDNMGFVGKDERKRFNFNTWTVGFIAKKKIAVYYTWYSGDTRATRQVGLTNNNSLTTNYKF
jgi:hypothetical protein